jgi:hypothetical protein
MLSRVRRLDEFDENAVRVDRKDEATERPANGPCADAEEAIAGLFRPLE